MLVGLSTKQPQICQVSLEDIGPENSGRPEKLLYKHACEETVVPLDAAGHRRALDLGELPLAGQLDA